MSTRSLTYIYEDINFAEDPNQLKPIACIYRHCDGYPTGMGADIKECLQNSRVVNGLSGFVKEKCFNGMGDLAAMLVHHVKKGKTGNVYIVKPILNINLGQEYEYHIRATKDGEIQLTIKNPSCSIWRGSVNSLNPRKVEER